MTDSQNKNVLQPPPGFYQLPDASGADEAAEEVADSTNWCFPSALGGNKGAVTAGSSCLAPPPICQASQPARPVHGPSLSCPAALHYSASSSALNAMAAAVDSAAPPPAPFSPALQASVAAWHSATSLLQELQQLQPEPILTSPPAPPTAVAAPLLLLPSFLPPAEQAQMQQQVQVQPAWLQAMLLGMQATAQEACSPERRPAEASEGSVSLLQLSR